MAEYQKNVEKAEVERIEAAKTAFKKREDAEITFRKATAKVQQEARKEAAAAKKSGSEKAEGSGKWVVRSGRFP